MDNKERLIEGLRDKIENMESRLTENEISIEQHQLEVERLQQRSVHVSHQLKRVEDNFETIPRPDIKVAYDDAIETRTRLLNMRGQLEKLQDIQNYLSQFRDDLQEIQDLLAGVDRASITASGGMNQAGEGGGRSLAAEQIVRIVEAQEAERKRLANALHDGPAQSLTNFILQAEICQRLFDRDPDSASTELGNLKTSASTSFQKIRDFIFDLRPMMLDDLGLIATVRRHVENYAQKHEGVEIKFHLVSGERRLPNHIEVMMFRGIQVLISNSMDILKATRIDVKLDVRDRVVKGEVEDNGKAFDPEVVLDRAQGDSPLQNLLDLRERIEMVGGTLEVYSSDDGTNSVEILLPFEG